jgi:hypothetical protein
VATAVATTLLTVAVIASIAVHVTSVARLMIVVTTDTLIHRTSRWTRLRCTTCPVGAASDVERSSGSAAGASMGAGAFIAAILARSG